ncbi:uncharacterized protein LOC118216563 isoform X2 [Anguilla anguilla]|nr:uncharacterized protein LOC118216563 isoform X2 [Anguilla anguilla]XP_035253757.1 uncharacterized protein LOC118216563 isoform X2 [Anguilla anguilla]
MLISRYPDNSVNVERTLPLWTGHSSQSQYRSLTGLGVTRHPPSYYHAVYDVRVERRHDAPFPSGGGGGGAGASPPETGAMGGTLYSEVTGGALAAPLCRRRGGLLDHRDMIKAHEWHKLHSTPKARRKEWENWDTLTLSTRKKRAADQKAEGRHCWGGGGRGQEGTPSHSWFQWSIAEMISFPWPSLRFWEPMASS